MNLYIYILKQITKLDGARLKTDSDIIKKIKTYITKPIGYQARKLLFNKLYK